MVGANSTRIAMSKEQLNRFDGAHLIFTFRVMVKSARVNHGSLVEN